MSVSRECNFFLADDSTWWMFLADMEHGVFPNGRYHGPFTSLDDAEDYLADKFSNPGSSWVDDSGKAKSPRAENPTGIPVVNPKKNSW